MTLTLNYVATENRSGGRWTRKERNRWGSGSRDQENQPFLWLCYWVFVCPGVQKPPGLTPLTKSLPEH